MHLTHPVTLSVLPSLRAGGVKVRIRHQRYVRRYGSSILDISASPLDLLRRFSLKDLLEDYLVLVPYARRWRRAEESVGVTPEEHALYTPLPCGGATTVDLSFPDGGSYTGTSVCSLKDRFNRRVGIAVALERALAARKVHARLGHRLDGVSMTGVIGISFPSQ